MTEVVGEDTTEVRHNSSVAYQGLYNLLLRTKILQCINMKLYQFEVQLVQVSKLHWSLKISQNRCLIFQVPEEVITTAVEEVTLGTGTTR